MPPGGLVRLKLTLWAPTAFSPHTLDQIQLAGRSGHIQLALVQPKPRDLVPTGSTASSLRVDF